MIKGYVIASEEKSSAKEAWNNFNKKLEGILPTLEGFKYCRRAPTLMRDRDFERVEDVYKVVARLTVSDEDLGGVNV